MGCADGGLAPGDSLRLGELFIGSRGVLHYLWHAVDQNGVVLDSLVQKRWSVTGEFEHMVWAVVRSS